MTLKEKLIEACGKLNEKNEFKVGDLVEWKEGMKNRNLPEYGEAVIITAVTPGILNPDPTDGGDSLRTRTPRHQDRDVP